MLPKGLGFRIFDFEASFLLRFGPETNAARLFGGDRPLLLWIARAVKWAQTLLHLSRVVADDFFCESFFFYIRLDALVSSRP